MAKRGERIFAWVGVVVAVVSAVALTAAVVIQQVIADRSTQSQLQDASSQSQSALACVDNATEQELAAPAKLTVTQPVTQLQVTDLKAGTGPAAKAGDCLIVKYYGTLATNGNVFDENYTSRAGFAFHLGNHEVITGWDQGLVGMQAGGERRLVIPADMAYGSQSTDVIPPNSTLVFDVTLLRIQ